MKKTIYCVGNKKTTSYNEAIIWQNEKEGVGVPILINN